MKRLFALHPVLHMNEEESLAYTKKSSVQEAARTLWQETQNTVIITLGAKGAYCFDGRESVLRLFRPCSNSSRFLHRGGAHKSERRVFLIPVLQHPEYTVYFAPGARILQIRPKRMKRLFALHPVPTAEEIWFAAVSASPKPSPNRRAAITAPMCESPAPMVSVTLAGTGGAKISSLPSPFLHFLYHLPAV